MSTNDPMYPGQTIGYPPGDTPVFINPPPTAHRCPVCGGRGTVYAGFYEGNFPLMSSASGVPREPCRSCLGTGVLWR